MDKEMVFARCLNVLAGGYHISLNKDFVNGRVLDNHPLIFAASAILSWSVSE